MKNTIEISTVMSSIVEHINQNNQLPAQFELTSRSEFDIMTGTYHHAIIISSKELDSESRVFEAKGYKMPVDKLEETARQLKSNIQEYLTYLKKESLKSGQLSRIIDNVFESNFSF